MFENSFCWGSVFDEGFKEKLGVVLVGDDFRRADDAKGENGGGVSKVGVVDDWDVALGELGSAGEEFLEVDILPLGLLLKAAKNYSLDSIKAFGT